MGQHCVDFILRHKAANIGQQHLAFGQLLPRQCQIPETGENVLRQKKTKAHQIGLHRDRIRKDLHLPDQPVQKFGLLHFLGKMIDAIRENQRRICHQGEIPVFSCGAVAVHIDQSLGGFSANGSGGFHVFELCAELPGFNQRADALCGIRPRYDLRIVGIPRTISGGHLDSAWVEPDRKAPPVQFKAVAVVVKGLHSQRDFLVRFADHRVKRQLHAGILAISAEPQCRIKRFGYKRRSGNRSVIRSLAIFGYRFKKARLPRI